MTSWKIGDLTIEPLTTEEIPKKVLQGSIPKTIHFPIISYDPIFGEVEYSIRTSTFIFDYKQPELLREVWNETYNSWFTKVRVNGCFETWCVIFF